MMLKFAEFNGSSQCDEVLELKSDFLQFLNLIGIDPDQGGVWGLKLFNSIKAFNAKNQDERTTYFAFRELVLNYLERHKIIQGEKMVSWEKL